MKSHLVSRLHDRCCAWLAVSAFALQSAEAATYLWNVASPGPNNWNVNANWMPSTGNPGPADTALFGDIGTGVEAITVNNVVSVSTTVSGLLYTNITAGSWHVTQVPASTTLTVTGPVTIGGQTGGGFTTSAAMIGGGTFLVTGTTNLFTLGNTTSSGSATPGTLDQFRQPHAGTGQQQHHGGDDRHEWRHRHQFPAHLQSGNRHEQP